eukprot:PITA_34386
MVDKVAELLCEYQDLFPTKFKGLKGIITDLGMMNITLKPDEKSIKQRSYHLKSKYKEKVHLELEKMLATGIIEPVEEFDWVSPMVVQEKKHKDERRICVHLKKLNDTCLHDPFPTSFTDEVLHNVGGQEAYSFTNGFSSELVSNARYLPEILYCDNLKKCMFCVPFGNLLGHVVCRQGLMVYPAKIVVILNLEVSRSVKQLHATLGHMGYYRKFIKGYAQITTPMEKLLKKDVTLCWDDDYMKSLD